MLKHLNNSVFVFAMIFTCMLLSGCTKKCLTEHVLYFECKIDGQEVRIEQEEYAAYYVNFPSKTEHGVCALDHVYMEQASNFTKTEINIQGGDIIVKLFQLECVYQNKRRSEIREMFKKGEYSYSPNYRYDEGVCLEIYYHGVSGPYASYEWISPGWNQENSKFVVTSHFKCKDDISQYITEGTFNCTLYNTSISEDSLVVTDGSFRMKTTVY